MTTTSSVDVILFEVFWLLLFMICLIISLSRKNVPRFRSTIELMSAFCYGLLLENTNVIGFFHTHPPGINSWSGVDWETQNGLAKTYGKAQLWYGVQALHCSYSEFVCSWMEGGKVFRYHQRVTDNLAEPFISLKKPPRIEWQGGSYTVYDD